MRRDGLRHILPVRLAERHQQVLEFLTRPPPGVEVGDEQLALSLVQDV